MVSLQPFAQGLEDASGIAGMLAANHQVVGIAKGRHLATASWLDGLFNPHIDHIVGEDVSQDGAADSPYTVGNFEFEQVIPCRRTWNSR